MRKGGGEEKVLIMLCAVPLETNENGQDICMQSVWTHFSNVDQKIFTRNNKLQF